MGRGPEDSTQAVAYFDFDGTLTRRDSLLLFLHFAAGPLGLAWGALRASPSLLAYGAGRLTNERAKARLLSVFFAGKEAAEFFSLAERFARTKLPRLVRPAGMARLAWHQTQGHRCVLVSASLEAYLAPWAESLGFEAVLATRLAQRQERLSGGFLGSNCYGPEKVARIRAWEAGKAIEMRYAYGDSAGDAAMLHYVQEGFLWSKSARTFKRL